MKAHILVVVVSLALLQGCSLEPDYFCTSFTAMIFVGLMFAKSGFLNLWPLLDFSWRFHSISWNLMFICQYIWVMNLGFGAYIPRPAVHFVLIFIGCFFIRRFAQERTQSLTQVIQLIREWVDSGECPPGLSHRPVEYWNVICRELERTGRI